MLISTRSRYALRALARMARMSGEGKEYPVSLSQLSEQEQVSVRYLEQIFGLLRSSGLVKGKRGPGGGYVLGMPPSKISLFDVVNVLETDFLPATCMAGETSCSPGIVQGEKRCSLEEVCVTRPLWMTLRDIYYSYMKDRSLQDLIEGNIGEQ
ncbi:MAG: Rrf2 family transcriptional regulator [Candidatus Fermentibacteraceae bacterium]|nr:Rrf2 family transcriptional regulator [Candidatus Fermentibacteraceae bacterium]MBN2608242.1 Rrf2 family transcriptional regulator [Candidatus Fermentibacteraceae bacterium]